MSASKRQRVVHLTHREHCLQRPDMYVGSLVPVETRFLDVPAGTHATLTVAPALVTLLNELVTNALDNCQRDDTQRYIKLAWQPGSATFVVANDGSTLPLDPESHDGDTWAPTRAFGVFQTGSNFDTAETGTKECVLTAGRNGVGAKGCNVFARRFAVRRSFASARSRTTYVNSAWYRRPNRFNEGFSLRSIRFSTCRASNLLLHETIGTIAQYAACTTECLRYFECSEHPLHVRVPAPWLSVFM